MTFTSKDPGKMFEKDKAGVVISTYYMISLARERTGEKESEMEKIRSIDWGLLILDEV